MQVELLYHTPDPERAIATAARLCYAPVGAAELMETMPPERVQSVLRTILKSGHFSTLEHASYTFAVDGVSRVLTHQLVRHRLASFNQQSQRYVKFKDGFDYITPPTITNYREGEGEDEGGDGLFARSANSPSPSAESDGDELFCSADASQKSSSPSRTSASPSPNKALAIFEAAMDSAARAYDELLSLGIPAEDARFVLPNATETKIVITMNVRELFHFFELRCCRRAQWEICELAHKMLELVRPTAPYVFTQAGAPCVSRTCPEGKMTCGRPYPKVVLD